MNILNKIIRHYYSSFFVIKFILFLCSTDDEDLGDYSGSGDVLPTTTELLPVPTQPDIVIPGLPSEYIRYIFNDSSEVCIDKKIALSSFCPAAPKAKRN